MSEVILGSSKEYKNHVIKISGSKSYTNRALILAALSNSKVKLYGYSPSNDSLVLIESLRIAGVEIQEKSDCLVVQGLGGKFEKQNIVVNTGIAGTSTRYFLALAALMPGQTEIQVMGKMKTRPLEDLVNALTSLGREIEYLENPGCAPLIIKPGRINKNQVALPGDISSQYFTALMMIGACIPDGLDIDVIGTQVSKSYIDMTIDIMAGFGVRAKNQNYQKYTIANASYESNSYNIEPDATGANYLFALAAINHCSIEILNLNKDSAQGDIKFLEILQEMGALVTYSKNSITVTGTKNFKAVTVDMDLLPDSAQTLAAIAVFAQGVTRITGLSTLKHKETDRINAMQTELAKLGVRVRSGEDWMEIEGKGLNYKATNDQIKFETYDDHRMAMSLGILGSKFDNIKILNSEVVAKSFPDFWQVMIHFGLKVKEI